jgi:hypothetical protein
MVQQKKWREYITKSFVQPPQCRKTLVGWIEALPPSLLQQMDALLVFVH